MIALGYVRRSKESEEDNVSLEVQRDLIVDYCRRSLGGTPVCLWADDGVSGSDRMRFERLYQKLREHRAEALVVYNLDRLSRDLLGQLQCLEWLKKRKIELHVTGRGRVETESASGFLLTGIEGLIAEHQLRLVREKTKDALAKLKADGRRYSRHAPFGYRHAADGSLVPDLIEGDVLATIQVFLGQGLGTRAICRSLEKAGIRARGGQPFASSTIHGILKASCRP